MINIKSAFSTAVLCTLLATAAPAFADTFLGGVSVSDADLPAVQKVCDAFGTPDNTAAPAQSLADANANDKDAKTQPLDKNAPGPNSVASIDVTTITLDQCKEAGLVK